MGTLLRNKPRGILSYFPAGYTPRDGQREVLLRIEAEYDNADVFAITLPVGAGKSLVSLTLAAWLNGEKKLPSNILAPSNVLVKQYTAQFPRLFCLERKEAHRCVCFPDFVPHEEANCEYYHKVNGEHCAECCYVKKVRQSHKMPYMVCNFHVYLAHKLYKHNLIVDEAHGLAGMIRSMSGKTLWHRQYNFPTHVRTYGTLLKWLQSEPRTGKLKELQEDLEAGRLRYLVEWGTEYLRGREEECLKLLPIDISKEKPILWPQKKVKKIFLLSATLSSVDIDGLGLGDRRVLFLTSSSPIPAERRPVVYNPLVNMAQAFLDTSIPRLAEMLKQTQGAQPGKGIVHVTYEVARQLQRHLSGQQFLFHNSENKMEVYGKWRASPPSEKQCLIACGLSEGIDLAGPDYTWQVIGKVPYLHLGEPAVKFMAETQPAQYAWEALRVLAQQTGRICRGPTDFGLTIIVDKQWASLRRRAEEFDLLPSWLAESLAAGEKLSGR